MYLMEYRVMSRVNRISSVDISCDKKLTVSLIQQFSLMSTCMAPQDSLRINIVGIIVTPAYMVRGNQHIIKILQAGTAALVMEKNRMPSTLWKWHVKKL